MVGSNTLTDFFVPREQFAKICHFVKPPLVVGHPSFHEKTRDPIFRLHHLSHQQIAVAQSSPSVPNLSRSHVALRQEITAQAIGDLARVNAIVLFLGGCDCSQHQRVCHFDLRRMRLEMIVDPPGKNRCLHCNCPGLRKSPHPAVQLAACRPKLAFLVNSTARILDAVADRLLVNIQSDVIHMSLRSLRGCCLNQPSG
jgi:hypothetical protein